MANDVVEEIFTRSRYRYKVDSLCSKITSYCLKNEDKHAQAIKRNGERRLKHDLDFTWLIRQVRNQKVLFENLLTDRERILLKFNDKHVIDSDSELMSSLGGSDSDLLHDYREKTVSMNVRESLVKTLRQRRRRQKCALLTRLDAELLESVGKYRRSQDGDKPGQAGEEHSMMDLQPAAEPESSNEEDDEHEHELDLHEEAKVVGRDERDRPPSAGFDDFERQESPSIFASDKPTTGKIKPNKDFLFSGRAKSARRDNYRVNELDSISNFSSQIFVDSMKSHELKDAVKGGNIEMTDAGSSSAHRP